ncbi:hypothetical protein RND71_009818 [Anisodus tanguticus]|uniref:Uncharacterized protein n=1 Tax=Anisodus tanguticus TaxID=243964 RepID=A0AAE1VHK1_9SOLA|nr:hypothetical protein RND71_009818 [Anisodus tanguticus]
MGRALEEAICYRVVLFGITRASLNTQSFISEASFQETARQEVSDDRSQYNKDRADGGDGGGNDHFSVDLKMRLQLHGLGVDKIVTRVNKGKSCTDLITTQMCGGIHKLKVLGVDKIATRPFDSLHSAAFVVEYMGVACLLVIQIVVASLADLVKVRKLEDNSMASQGLQDYAD